MMSPPQRDLPWLSLYKVRPSVTVYLLILFHNYLNICLLSLSPVRMDSSGKQGLSCLVYWYMFSS